MKSILRKLKQGLKDSLVYNPVLSTIYNHLIGHNTFHIGDNVFMCKGNILRHTIVNVKGSGNVIEIMTSGGNTLNFCKIDIFGNNNKIQIGNGNLLNNVRIWIEDDCGSIIIGNDNRICGSASFAVIEGCHITIGHNNLFSTNVDFKTGDSHSILSVQTGKRINPSLPIVVGEHNWFGHNTTILKGVEILSHVIIGTGSIVTKSPGATHIALAGIPAKVIKQKVTWNMERTKNY